MPSIQGKNKTIHSSFRSLTKSSVLLIERRKTLLVPMQSVSAFPLSNSAIVRPSCGEVKNQMHVSERRVQFRLRSGPPGQTARTKSWHDVGDKREVVNAPSVVDHEEDCWPEALKTQEIEIGQEKTVDGEDHRRAITRSSGSRRTKITPRCPAESEHRPDSNSSSSSPSHPARSV